MADKSSLNGVMKMPSTMESPLNAQKEGAEPGPSAPTGLPNWAVKDPLGICPGDNSGKGKK